MRLYSDLLQGKVVVINTLFTKCENSCPLMAGNFAALQEHFADQIGKHLFLLSFSVDPIPGESAAEEVAEIRALSSMRNSLLAREMANQGWVPFGTGEGRSQIGQEEDGQEGATAPPIDDPLSNSATAQARSRSGNHSETALAAPGQPADSPAPSNPRKTRKPPSGSSRRPETNCMMV